MDPGRDTTSMMEESLHDFDALLSHLLTMTRYMLGADAFRLGKVPDNHVSIMYFHDVARETLHLKVGNVVVLYHAERLSCAAVRASLAVRPKPVTK